MELFTGKLFRASLMAGCMLALIGCSSYSDRDVDKEKEEKAAEAKAATKEENIPFAPKWHSCAILTRLRITAAKKQTPAIWWLAPKCSVLTAIVPTPKKASILHLI